jgi:hypothetical protein
MELLSSVKKAMSREMGGDARPTQVAMEQKVEATKET